MKRIFCLIMMIVTLAARALGETTAPDLKFTHYTTADGLPSNCVRAITQDEDGFMWFGSDGGLVRFDGTRTRVFVPEEETESGEVFVLSLCRYGRGLLVGTDRALCHYNPVTESLRQLPLSYPESVTERVAGNIHDIALDSKGNVWVAVEGNGVFRIEMPAAGSTGNGVTAESQGMVKGHFSFPDTNDFVGQLYIDSNDIVWALSNTNGGGLYRYDPTRDTFRDFRLSDAANLQKKGALAMTADDHGNYWLGTWENGIVRFNPRNGEARQFTSPADNSRLWHIHSITPYSPTLLLVGSDSGLTLVDTSAGTCRVYQADELDPASLSDRFVYPISRDSDGGIWIGTFYRGVNYLPSGSQRFRSWTHSRFANSVSGNVVSRLCEDYKGNIWIGTADGGLCMYDPERNVFRDYTLIDRNEPENICALCPDEGHIWVGTYTKGVGRLDISSGRWIPVPMEGLGSVSCYAINKDSKGRVWIGATETLALYNRDRNRFEPVSSLKAWINDIDEDSDGNLWISTQGRGLFRYEPEKGEWTNYVASKSPGSLPDNHINSVTADISGNLFVSTSQGVYRYDRNKEKFFRMSDTPERISAQSVEKSGDELWISTAKGLLNVKADGRSRLYGIGDGLSDSQFMPGSSVAASDGRLYYGTVHGFTRIDPMELRCTSGAPKMVFTGLDIVNNPVAVGTDPLPQSLNDIDKLTLTHGDHTFSIYFSALSYANPGGNSYSYRLEGFDKTWLEAGKENRATYSNLPAGTYTFRVRATNSDGVVNEDGLALRIVVKPAWYASALMKALYLVLGIGLLLLAVRLIVKRMERNHIVELDRISSNKEKEMFRSKLNFFTIVAHEIRTPVSLIIGPLEKILESAPAERFSASVKEDLQVIDRNAHRLLSLVNQLLDYKKVEDNPLPMGFRKERIVPLVESVAERFRPSLEQKGVELTVDCPDPSLTVDIDPEAVTKLVSNLLNNARKFTKDRIEVECRPMPDGRRFMISVSDNGIGIERENRDKIFKPFFQVLDNINESKGGTGLGLSIVKSVAEAHGGEVELESSPGKGSRFIAILPIHQENVMPAPERLPEVDEDEETGNAAPEGTADRKPVMLVVDDNEEMVRFVSSHFEKSYTVVTAANGREALQRMGENNVGMIICDWMMPVMDGVEFLKAVRDNENYSHIPFVMLTAKTDNTSKITTMRNGADAYVEKPFSIGYLEARIDNLLEMRALLRKKFAGSPLEPITTIAPTQTDTDLLTRLQGLIEENISNPELNVDSLAEQLGISRSGLYAKIKSLADVTPRELIQLTRLKKAAEYLAEGKYQVQEVSYMVGFANSSYFSKCFHKQFGVRPAEFGASTQQDQ